MTPILEGCRQRVQRVWTWFKREEPFISTFLVALVMVGIALLPELGVFQHRCPPMYLAYWPIKIIAGSMVVGFVDMCQERFWGKEPPSES